MTLTLEDFYSSKHFEYWDSDNRSASGCGMILEDTERYDRIEKAAEYSGEGSTHEEIMNDWLDALETLEVVESEHGYGDTEAVTDLEAGVITERDYAMVTLAIAECYDWHEKNGSLNKEVG